MMAFSSKHGKWPDTIGAGECDQLEPLVRRVLAPNPSPYTFTGTQTWIVGAGRDVAIIDPGPVDDGTSGLGDVYGAGHLDAILRAVEGQRVAAILCTHTHRDHSPAARPLKQLTGAPILGCAPLALVDEGPREDSPFDLDYAPDRELADGERVSGDGWTLEAVSTPGHTSNHLCFALVESDALFTGDHVMSWSTSVVSPPDGDMAKYMASLRKLELRNDRIFYPAHGPACADPRSLVRHMLAHRENRERQILGELSSGASSVAEIVDHLYVDLDSRLVGAAGRSVLAHLFDLQQRRRVAFSGSEWVLIGESEA